MTLTACTLFVLRHPDKNADNIDEATEKFKEIQNAYAVLSDPNERKWYDGHKAQILRGDSESDDEQQPGDFGAGRPKYQAPTFDKYCSTSCYKGFGNGAGGFYATYRGVFAQVDEEEEAEEDVGSYHRAFPQFGDSALDHDAVGTFYREWAEFVTKREFTEADKYDIRQAPDRWVKRKMESENKKARTKAKKKYTEQVRSMVEFAQRHDPRWKAREEAIAAEKAEKCAASLLAPASLDPACRASAVLSAAVQTACPRLSYPP